MSDKLQQFIHDVSLITNGESFINGNNELIIFRKENIYMSLDGIESIEEIRINVLSSLSRYAIKGVSAPKQKQVKMIIKNVFGFNLSDSELDHIYKKYGNGIDNIGLAGYINEMYEQRLFYSGIIGELLG